MFASVWRYLRNGKIIPNSAGPLLGRKGEYQVFDRAIEDGAGGLGWVDAIRSDDGLKWFQGTRHGGSRMGLVGLNLSDHPYRHLRTPLRSRCAVFGSTQIRFLGISPSAKAI